MGRPPMHVMETKVRLTDDMRERIEAIVGPNRMASFIREAIENELNKREAEQDNGRIARSRPAKTDA